jgi:hypothetical protein
MKTKILVLALAASLFQCSKIKDILPDKNTSVAPETPKITKFGNSSPENVLAVVRVGIDLKSYIPSQIPTLPGGFDIPPIDYTTAIANFGNPGKDAGGEVKVSVANKSYTLTKNEQSGNVSYAYGVNTDFKSLGGTESFLGIPLNTSGDATATFSVPAAFNISQSTVVVPGPVKITSIQEGASISKSNGVTIEFTSSNANFYVGLVSDTKGNQTILKESNTKKIVFTEAELAIIKAGDAIVYAVAVNYKLSNSNKNVVVGESVGIKNIKIN